jgi:hypothetical protein
MAIFAPYKNIAIAYRTTGTAEYVDVTRSNDVFYQALLVSEGMRSNNGL